MYKSIYENSILDWLNKNRNYYNYDHLPHLLTQLDEIAISIESKYEFNSLNVCVLNYLNSFVNYHHLKNDFELVESFYQECFNYKKCEIHKNKRNYLNILLFLNDFDQGKAFLNKNGIDFSKYGKYRDLAFEKVLETNFFSTKELELFSPKVINHKELLDKKLSIPMCKFLNNNGFEIPKNYLCSLIIKIYNSLLDENKTYNSDSFLRLHKTQQIQEFSNLLVNNASFKNYIAPVKDIHLGIYTYFDKIFPVPKDLNFTSDELNNIQNRKKYFLNEFSKQLFNNPNLNLCDLKSP